MKKILVIYHDTCADGFASMMIARGVYGDEAEYVACQYNRYNVKSYDTTVALERTGIDPTQDVFLNGRKIIYILDFSFKRSELNQMANSTTQHIIVLDHHKTAQAELMESDENGYWHKHLQLADKVAVGFNMRKAGAKLTWEHFYTSPMPVAFELIALRDIWAHKDTELQEDAEAMNMYVGTIGYDVAKWRPLLEDDVFTRKVALPQGRAVLGFFNQKIKEAVPHAIAVGASRVVNAPYWMASELGNKLAEDADYAVIWSYANDGSVIASLRSIGTKCDVSAIAKRYNGGGHANAAGCKFANFAEFQAAFLSS